MANDFKSFLLQASSTVLHMLHHCKLHHVWLQSKLCMGSVFTTGVGIVRRSVGIIKDIHFRGMHVSCVVVTSTARVTVDM